MNKMIVSIRKGVKRLNATRRYSRIRKMSEKELLLNEIREIRFLIKIAYFKLSAANENAIIESCILELRSLEIRHAYLLNKLKEVDK